MNNGGYTIDRPVHLMTDDDFQEMLDIHAIAPFRVLRAAAPHLREPAKNHRHSTANPRAQFREEYTLDEIKQSHMIHEPLTKLQCSPTSDGGAAALVASERFVNEQGLWEQAVEIVGQAMVTDLPSTFDERRSSSSAETSPSRA